MNQKQEQVRQKILDVCDQVLAKQDFYYSVRPDDGAPWRAIELTQGYLRDEGVLVFDVDEHSIKAWRSYIQIRDRAELNRPEVWVANEIAHACWLISEAACQFGRNDLIYLTQAKIESAEAILEQLNELECIADLAS